MIDQKQLVLTLDCPAAPSLERARTPPLTRRGPVVMETRPGQRQVRDLLPPPEVQISSINSSKTGQNPSETRPDQL